VTSSGVDPYACAARMHDACRPALYDRPVAHDDASNPLLRPVSMGDLAVRNRVWMAPLTRARATMPGNIPNTMMRDYYTQRAGAGVIISEATPIAPRAHGYYATPGIHSDAQVEGWRAITDAVHERGGAIVLQLWHVGRVSHTDLQPDHDPPIGPGETPAPSKVYTDATMQRRPCSAPRALGDAEVPGIVGEFARATRRAKAAGFDGVEIHGANSYLLDQFTRDGMNTRTGAYGSTLSGRLRFPIETARAVVDAWGDPSRVGYRISPLSEKGDVRDSDPGVTFAALARELGSMGLGYLHAVETWDRSEHDARIDTVIPAIAHAFKDAGGGLYVANGDLDPDGARRFVESGWCDAVAFGKLWISNPDLTERIARGGPYAPWDADTFYGGGAEGYTDYPSMGGLEGAYTPEFPEGRA